MGLASDWSAVSLVNATSVETVEIRISLDARFDAGPKGYLQDVAQRAELLPVLLDQLPVNIATLSVELEVPAYIQGSSMRHLARVSWRLVGKTITDLPFLQVMDWAIRHPPNSPDLPSFVAALSHTFTTSFPLFEVVVGKSATLDHP